MKHHKVKSMESLTIPVAFQVIFISIVLIWEILYTELIKSYYLVTAYFNCTWIKGRYARWYKDLVINTSENITISPLVFQPTVLVCSLKIWAEYHQNPVQEAMPWKVLMFLTQMHLFLRLLAGFFLQWIDIYVVLPIYWHSLVSSTLSLPHMNQISSSICWNWTITP